MTRWLLVLSLALVVAGELVWLAARDTAPVVAPLPAVTFPADPGHEHIERLYAAIRTDHAASGSVDDHQLAADLLLGYGRVADAARCYRQLLRRADDHPSAWRGLGMALDQLGQLAAADRAYTRALELDPSHHFNPLYRHRIAELHQQRGELASARALYAANAEHPPSRLRLAALLLRAGERAAAAEAVVALQRDPEAARSVELAQVVELSRRLYGEPIADLMDQPREALFVDQPIDLFRIAVQDHYGLELEALGDHGSGPQPAADRAVLAARVVAALADPAAAERGRKVYAAGSCALCHGEHGYGGLGPNLRDDYWLGEASPLGLLQVITEGRPGSAMAAHGSLLRDDQLRDLVVYLIRLNRDTPTSSGRSSRGKAPEGRLRPLQLEAE